MDNNIYKAPKSKLGSDVTRKKGSPVKAVLVAIVVDIVGTMVYVALLGLAYGIYVAELGLSVQEMKTSLANQLLGPLAMIGGSLISVYCGYLCAKIANHEEYRYAGMVGIFMVVFGFVFTGGDISNIRHIAENLLTLVCVMGGAWWYVKHKPVEDPTTR